MKPLSVISNTIPHIFDVDSIAPARRVSGAAIGPKAAIAGLKEIHRTRSSSTCFAAGLRGGLIEEYL
jgi:hypothetical protein